MNTPTCRCSLLRLGLHKDNAVAYNHKGEKHHFCCQGYVDVFITDQSRYLQETNDLVDEAYRMGRVLIENLFKESSGGKVTEGITFFATRYLLTNASRFTKSQAVLKEIGNE